MGLGEEDHRDKMPFSSHHIKSTYYQRDISTQPYSHGWGLYQVSPLQIYPPLSLSYCTLWEEVTIHSSHFRTEGLRSTSLRVKWTNYLYFWTGDVSVFLHLFLSYQYGLERIYFIFWFIIRHYFVAGIAPVLATETFWHTQTIEWSDHLLSGSTRCFRLLLNISCPTVATYARFLDPSHGEWYEKPRSGFLWSVTTQIIPSPRFLLVCNFPHSLTILPSAIHFLMVRFQDTFIAL